jgi:hypothetical protein
MKGLITTENTEDRERGKIELREMGGMGGTGSGTEEIG